jgi:hypothetical protein
MFHAYYGPNEPETSVSGAARYAVVVTINCRPDAFHGPDIIASLRCDGGSGEFRAGDDGEQ